jgi:hypothetical protein
MLLLVFLLPLLYGAPLSPCFRKREKNSKREKPTTTATGSKQSGGHRLP